MYTENIERLFYEDVREKKKAGSGAFHKRGKGVKHHMSGIKTPYDFMKTKERKQLNGEVTISNMYETILTKREFDLKDEETQKLMLTRWRELYTNNKIMEEMQISNNAAFFKLVGDLGLEKKRKGVPRLHRTSEVERSTIIQPTIVTKEQSVPVFIPNPKGLSFNYHGEYKAEQINRILTKIQLLLEEEENNFHIDLSLVEVEKNDD